MFTKRQVRRNARRDIAERTEPLPALVMLSGAPIDQEIDAGLSDTLFGAMIAKNSAVARSSSVGGVLSGFSFSFADIGDGVIESGTEDVQSLGINHGKKKAIFGGVEIEAIGGVRQIGSIGISTSDGRPLASGDLNALNFVQLTGFTLIGKNSKKLPPLPKLNISVTRDPNAPAVQESVTLVIRQILIRKTAKGLIQLTTLPNAKSVTFLMGPDSVDPGPGPGPGPGPDPVKECVQVEGGPTASLDLISSITGLVNSERVDLFAPADAAVIADRITLSPDLVNGVTINDVVLLRANPNSPNATIPLTILSRTVTPEGDWLIDFVDFEVPQGTNVILEADLNLDVGDTSDLSVLKVCFIGDRANILWDTSIDHAPTPVNPNPNPNPTIYMVTDHTPFQITDAVSAIAGERIGMQVILSAPASNPVTTYYIDVTGDFSGVSSPRFFRSEPNGVECDVPFATTETVNPDGSRRYTLTTPYVTPTGSATKYQYRFDLVGGQKVDLTFMGVGVSGLAASVDWTDDINWN